jgi:UDP-3-O-[3-hydroxymyristoyl] glucosamine N-acyltransferase
MPSLTVAQLAEVCGGTSEGDSSRAITGAESLEHATARDLSFVGSEKSRKLAIGSQAGCLIVTPSFDLTGPWSLIRTPEPRLAFTKALHALYPNSAAAPSIHPTAVIALTAVIAPDCSIGAYTVIGERSQIALGCRIASGCSIGQDVQLGKNTVLHANITVYDRVRIGERVILHSGTVLGADGFGFTLVGDRYEKFPQVGTVEIGDDVEIGANCCVDRAALGVTRISEGCKLDNLVHVAHNCELGKHVVVAAQTGFSGGVVVGDHAVIGGQAGIGEKAIIDSCAIVGGKSGILTSQRVRAGEPVWGIPARPLKQHLTGLANVARLPELRQEVRKISRKLETEEPAQGGRGVKRPAQQGKRVS